MIDFNAERLAWEKMNNLLPAIIQDAQTGRVLMLGYMNQDALTQTLTTQIVTFYSRSKKRLWVKGETSGNKLDLVAVSADCDNDTLLILANPQGPSCHQGTESCFANNVNTPWQVIPKLEAVLQQRNQQRPADSYTTTLFEAGISRMAQKVGEEGVEVALAAVCEDENTLCNEAADLVFHLLVLLQAKKLKLNHVLEVLVGRMARNLSPLP